MALRSLSSVLIRSVAATALLCASASAQLSQAWVEKFADPSYPASSGSAVAFLPGGDFVVAGYAAAGSLAWTRDFLAVRYDSQGNQVWARTYDGPQQSQDEAKAVRVDFAGNVIVAGLSKGTATSTSDDALAICKYAPDGTLLWTQRYERLGPSQSSLGQWGGLGVDSSGNVYVAGSALANTPGATVDVVLVAYDALGTQRWVASHDGPYAFIDLALDLAVTPTDELRLTGLSMAFAGAEDCATYSYSSDGSLRWVAYEPTSSGKHIAVNGDGTTFVIGQSLGTGDLQVLAYDSAGNRLWKSIVDGPVGYSENPGGLCPGAAGDLYVTASTGSFSFPPQQDLLIARVSPLGDVLWTRIFGSAVPLEAPRDIATDGAGNVYVAGLTTVVTQVGDSVRLLALKYSPAGTQLGHAEFGEPTGPFGFSQAAASALALAEDASFLIVTGRSLEQCTTLRYDHSAPPEVYCTSKPSSIAGCVPTLGGNSSSASVSGAGMCHVVCAPVPGGSKPAIAIASTGGPLNPPVLQTFGWLCIESGPGFFRLPADQPGGTSGHCDGYYEFDVTAWLASHAGNPALVPGGTLDLQVWYRDPPNPGGANLSNALGLDLVP
jgi:hypothetical protein